MKLGFLDTFPLEYVIETPYCQPLGGSQSALCYLAEALATRGHEVFLFNNIQKATVSRGVKCQPRGITEADIPLLRNLDALIVLNTAIQPNSVKPFLGEKTRLILWTQHEPLSQPVWYLKDQNIQNGYDNFVLISDWQKRQFEYYFKIPSEKICILRNAFSPVFVGQFPQNQNREFYHGWSLERFSNCPILSQKSDPPILAYMSTPYRGLDILLKVFPQIRARVPGVTLKVFSSMKIYQSSRIVVDDVPFQSLYDQCQALEGVEYMGAVSQGKLAQELRSVLMLAYPNTFPETSCISVMEALASGCLVVTSNLAALPETTGGFADLIAVENVRQFSTIQNWSLADNLNWQPYLNQFTEKVVENLILCQQKPQLIEEKLQKQVNYMNRLCTWQVRAHQWVQWLKGLGIN